MLKTTYFLQALLATVFGLICVACGVPKHLALKSTPTTGAIEIRIVGLKSNTRELSLELTNITRKRLTLVKPMLGANVSVEFAEGTKIVQLTTSANSTQTPFSNVVDLAPGRHIDSVVRLSDIVDVDKMPSQIARCHVVYADDAVLQYMHEMHPEVKLTVIGRHESNFVDLEFGNRRIALVLTRIE